MALSEAGWVKEKTSNLLLTLPPRDATPGIKHILVPTEKISCGRVYRCATVIQTGALRRVELVCMAFPPVYTRDASLTCRH